jgi:DNA invertase Pin-like site-specific DNA recombinase
MPNANRLTVRIMVMVAKDEGLRISARSKAGLAAAKARHEAGPDRGVKPSARMSHWSSRTP